MADSNSLGLDFEKETTKEETKTEQPANTGEQETKPEKKKPYVNPERVKTGGPQRVGVVLSWLTRARLTTGRRKSCLRRSSPSACSASRNRTKRSSSGDRQVHDLDSGVLADRQ